MNEKEFAKSILIQIKNDKVLDDWYKKNVDGKPFKDTVEILISSIGDPLTIRQVIQMALFIGLSTEMLLE